jgi:streptomycin 6-kinase
VTITVPARLAELHATSRGSAGREWIRRLPELASSYLQRWRLTCDGPVWHGIAALALPVHLADGTAAVLKLQNYDPEHYGEAAALQAWAGGGSVRLLDADITAEREVLLLERLHADRPLSTVEDDDTAVAVIGGLLARLHAVPPPPEIRTLSLVVAGMLDSLPSLVPKLTSAEEGDFVRRLGAHTAEVAADPGDRLLHWDLHYDNVLAGDREPWLAIDPKPLQGDPGFDLLPALDNRVSPATLGETTLRRFDQLVELLGLDRHRAAAWSLARVLQNCLWEIEDGGLSLDAQQVAIGQILLTHRL